MPVPLLAAAGIAAAGGLASNIVGNSMTNAANMQLAKYQYKKDLEMWNAANVYNSPEQQMLRLKAANLNPNLVYGNGSVVGNVTSQLPKYQAPRIQYQFDNPVANLPSMIMMYQDLKKSQSQIDLVDSQRRAVEQKILNDAVTNELLRNKAQYSGQNEYNNAQKLMYQSGEAFARQNKAHIEQKFLYDSYAQRLQQVKMRNDLLTQEFFLKKRENELRDLGLGQNDNPLLRVIGRAMQNNEWRKYWKF